MNKGMAATEEALIQKAREKREYFQSKILEWASENLRDFPWRRGTTPYSVLIVEVLLRRTTSTAVKRIFPTFLERYPDVKALAKAKRLDLQEIMSPLGYHIERAKIFLEIANYLEANYGGEIPRSKEALMRIPHVGQYTAGATLSFGYGIPSSMVDSNIERIIRRFFKSRIPPKGKLSWIIRTAEELVPEKKHRIYNLALIDYGALVCRYDTPRCVKCNLRRKCDYYQKILLNGEFKK